MRFLFYYLVIAAIICLFMWIRTLLDGEGLLKSLGRIVLLLVNFAFVMLVIWSHSAWFKDVLDQIDTEWLKVGTFVAPLVWLVFVGIVFDATVLKRSVAQRSD